MREDESRRKRDRKRTAHIQAVPHTAERGVARSLAVRCTDLVWLGLLLLRGAGGLQRRRSGALEDSFQCGWSHGEGDICIGWLDEGTLYYKVNLLPSAVHPPLRCKKHPTR